MPILINENTTSNLNFNTKGKDYIIFSRLFISI